MIIRREKTILRFLFPLLVNVFLFLSLDLLAASQPSFVLTYYHQDTDVIYSSTLAPSNMRIYSLRNPFKTSPPGRIAASSSFDQAFNDYLLNISVNLNQILLCRKILSSPRAPSLDDLHSMKFYHRSDSVFNFKSEVLMEKFVSLNQLLAGKQASILDQLLFYSLNLNLQVDYLSILDKPWILTDAISLPISTFSLQNEKLLFHYYAQRIAFDQFVLSKSSFDSCSSAFVKKELRTDFASSKHRKIFLNLLPLQREFSFILKNSYDPLEKFDLLFEVSAKLLLEMKAQNIADGADEIASIWKMFLHFSGFQDLSLNFDFMFEFLPARFISDRSGFNMLQWMRFMNELHEAPLNRNLFKRKDSFRFKRIFIQNIHPETQNYVQKYFPGYDQVDSFFFYFEPKKRVLNDISQFLYLDYLKFEIVFRTSTKGVEGEVISLTLKPLFGKVTPLPEDEFHKRLLELGFEFL